MSIKTIFLDRDGVINKDIKYLYRIEDFEFIDGILNTCKHLVDLGYKIIIITNQSGIYRKIFNENEYQKLTNWMVNEFKIRNIDILDIFHCPHGPKSQCDCRKPKPGMFIKAKKKYDINMELSWMIGDSESDIAAANMAGIDNTILVRSGQKIYGDNSNAKFILNSVLNVKRIINK